jgi:hypothetical protein
VVRLEPRPRVSIMTVVRLERWVERWAGFLVAERVRLPLPFELLLAFDLRRASLRHLTFCRSILTLKDAALSPDPQENFLIYNQPFRTIALPTIGGRAHLSRRGPFALSPVQHPWGRLGQPSRVGDRGLAPQKSLLGSGVRWG